MEDEPDNDQGQDQEAVQAQKEFKKQTPAPDSGSGEQIALTVYKDPNCACCSEWIAHMEKNHFSVEAINSNDLESIKADKNIPAQYQSCHTGISTEGYFFEGHVPAKTIKRFLSEKPEGALGLTVPSMPVGSPGMEVGDKFMPYKVFMMKASGEMEVYAEFASYQEQF